MPVLMRGGGGGKKIKDATAVPGDVAQGEVFYNNDGRQVGSAELSGLKTYAFSISLAPGNSPFAYYDSMYFSKNKTMKACVFNEFGGLHYSYFENKTPLKIKVNNQTILTLESLTYAKLVYSPSAISYRIAFDGGASQDDGLYNLAICFKDNQIKYGIVSDSRLTQIDYDANWYLVIYYA